MYVEPLFWQISAILEKHECHRHHDFTSAILIFMYFSSVHSIYDDLDYFLVMFFFFRKTLNEFAYVYIQMV